MAIADIEKSDPEVAAVVRKELERQRNGLELIPSENFASPAVMAAVGSVLTNKYSEGYPHKRYYGGNEFIDQVEDIAIERAKKIFGVEHVNVQPYSGSPANFAVYMAVCEKGDTVTGLNLVDGGHLTHGWKVSAGAIFFNSVPYHVRPDGYIDFDNVREIARKHKPKLIWCGATAYPREFPFKEFGEIADEVGAYLVADIAHISGLVAAGVHPSPVPYAHIVTTTTHKTLRGPRGGMIMVTKKGIEKDPDLPAKIDKAVFPGLQGGPHDHVTAGIAVALKEAMQPEFREYAEQIVKNSRALASALADEGMKLVTGGSDNHLLLIDLTPFGKGKGLFAQEALDLAGMTVNKNTIPAEPASPFYPSGVRLGTPAVTTRGMKEEEMKLIGKWMADVIKEAVKYEMPDDREKRKDAIALFRKEIAENSVVKETRQKVLELCKRFPLYPDLE
ncbi:serine hydroxymethyltransferase [Candidatus Woesearchaeota archaeon]|nr:MAG: serine hydroxymethyltransferase [Candidatus Woesearchaeota archaeon]